MVVKKPNFIEVEHVKEDQEVCSVIVVDEGIGLDHLVKADNQTEVHEALQSRVHGVPFIDLLLQLCEGILCLGRVHDRHCLQGKPNIVLLVPEDFLDTDRASVQN